MNGVTVRSCFCDRYVQGYMGIDNDGRPLFYPASKAGGSAVLGLWQVNGLARIPEGVHRVHEGDDVEV